MGSFAAEFYENSQELIPILFTLCKTIEREESFQTLWNQHYLNSTNISDEHKCDNPQ